AGPATVRRPERGHARRPRPLPRRRAGPDRGHGLATDGRLPPPPVTHGLRGPPRRPGARPAAAARARDGEHAHERAVRGSLGRAAPGLVGEDARTRALLAVVSPASPRPRLARPLRRGAGAPRRGGAGAELHRPGD